MTAIGLKNIHVAVLTETGDSFTYGKPRKIAHAITANITPNSENTVLHGDDQVIESEETLGDIDVEINVSDLSAEDYAFLLGKTVDANNGVTDKTSDVAPYVALGFEVPLTKSRKRVYWYYKGKFGVPSSEHTTKQGTTAYQTPTISGKFFARNDEKWRYRVDSNESNAAVINEWFDAVAEEPASVPEP